MKAVIKMSSQFWCVVHVLCGRPIKLAQMTGKCLKTHDKNFFKLLETTRWKSDKLCCLNESKQHNASLYELYHQCSHNDNFQSSNVQVNNCNIL